MLSPAKMPLRRVVRVTTTQAFTGRERQTLHLECGHVENIPLRSKAPKSKRCVACVAERDDGKVTP